MEKTLLTFKQIIAHCKKKEYIAYIPPQVCHKAGNFGVRLHYENVNSPIVVTQKMSQEEKNKVKAGTFWNFYVFKKAT